MNWFASIGVAVLSGILGLGCGVVFGDRCVKWFRVSTMEGNAGFAALGIALLCGLGATAVGLLVARLGAAGEAPTFLKGLGLAAVAVVGLIALVAALCWSVADIPPEIDGHRLTLEVELMLPVGSAQPAHREGADSEFELSSVVRSVQRGSWPGTLHLGRLRRENGRWIVPASVRLETMRGKRALGFKINGGESIGFLAPIPARPGRDSLEWSHWMPRPPAGSPEWPDTKPSFRFRLQPILPPPPGPTHAEIQAKEEAEAQAKFDAIDTHSSVSAWLPYTRYGAHEGRMKAAIERIVARPGHVAEIAKLMATDDVETATDALRFVQHHPQPDDELVAAVRAAAAPIVARLREFVPLPVQADPGYEKAADISRLFSAWHSAVLALRKKLGADFTPQLAEILALARQRDDSIALRMDVVRVASYYLHEWAGVAPLPTDPKPR